MSRVSTKCAFFPLPLSDLSRMALEAHIKIQRITWKHQGAFFILMLLINLWYLSSIISRPLEPGMFNILFSPHIIVPPSSIFIKLVFLDRSSYANSVGPRHKFVDLLDHVLRAFRPETSTYLYA